MSSRTRGRYATKEPRKPAEPVPSKLECFEAVPDARVNRTLDHKLIDVVVIGNCATLTVGENFTDMEALTQAMGFAASGKELW